MQPKEVGRCNRKDGRVIPVYFVHEIENGKAQIHDKSTDEFLDLRESYKSLGGAKANHPNRPLFYCNEA